MLLFIIKKVTHVATPITTSTKVGVDIRTPPISKFLDPALLMFVCLSQHCFMEFVAI